MDNSVMTCDEIINANAEVSHTKQKLFQQILMKKVAFKTQNFYILLAFLIITTGLLIAVNIYCYLIKY